MDKCYSKWWNKNQNSEHFLFVGCLFYFLQIYYVFSSMRLQLVNGTYLKSKQNAWVRSNSMNIILSQNWNKKYNFNSTCIAQIYEMLCMLMVRNITIPDAAVDSPTFDLCLGFQLLPVTVVRNLFCWILTLLTSRIQ